MAYIILYCVRLTFRVHFVHRQYSVLLLHFRGSPIIDIACDRNEKEVKVSESRKPDALCRTGDEVNTRVVPRLSIYVWLLRLGKGRFSIWPIVPYYILHAAQREGRGEEGEGSMKKRNSTLHVHV